LAAQRRRALKVALLGLRLLLVDRFKIERRRLQVLFESGADLRRGFCACGEPFDGRGALFFVARQVLS
jgi:hypothetical protein